MLQVGEVSRKLGINAQTIYFYERIGLIPSPQRSESGYRLFSEQDIERLLFIHRAKSLGLTLEEIKDILALKDGKKLTCQALHQRLINKIKQIEQQMIQLQMLHEELLPLVEQCEVNLNHPDPTHECIVLNTGQNNE
ncbi:heavy metal-responsive transcriptional regulator [Limnoraphis robusta Tam1]|uniref:heavy metal-responsive transcriptional regulator n=1 Tax=Limnoraphis robusta TaxID=1118279 RepID=UPI002B1F002B|nr:heavy metal-responsive transcriptional regulator [Limnoraphis robusta]MEA5539560.1 heavy metal-responsive transcriptional regulator [Limnoraphis robusta Tam1]